MTTEFQNLLDSWKRDGVVTEWRGQFGSASVSADHKLTMSTTASTSPRYIGVPTMNNICKKLLDHPKIRTTFGGKASPILSTTRGNQLSEVNLKFAF